MSKPAADTPDSRRHDLVSHRRLRPMAIGLMVALTIGLLLIALIAHATPAGEEKTTRGGSGVVLLLPILLALGYALGNPGLWEGGRSCLGVTLAVVAVMLVLGSLADSLLGALIGRSAFETVLPPLITAVSIEASALLSCLLHDQLDRKLYRRIGLTLAIVLYCLMLAFWALAVSRVPPRPRSAQERSGEARFCLAFGTRPESSIGFDRIGREL